MVEFALILPILLLLVMGLFDIGRVIFYYATLNTAVREGTRFAIVQPYCDYRADPTNCSGVVLDTYPLICSSATSKANINICKAITDKYFKVGELASSEISIDYTVSSTDDPQIKIVIDYLFKPVAPGLALFGDIPIQVNSQMILLPIAQP
ncbi:MAG TPA: TadE family protein [Anaerolineaceae bacterium]|nr:TadE family protein [Anaerolineaceae bacterium]